MKETQNLERLALISRALIWSWCLSHSATPMYASLIWLPLPINFLAPIRSLGLLLQMRSQGRYIKLVEESFDLPDNLGWESSGYNDPVRVIAGIFFWLALIAGGILIPSMYGNALSMPQP